MREVRVESLEGLETAGDGVRLVANAGELALVFGEGVWEALSGLTLPLEPGADELAELANLEHKLVEHARANAFDLILEDAALADGGFPERLDLVLRPSGPFALTTGYVFVPVARREHVDRLEASLSGSTTSVEGAYLVGAVAEEGAFAGRTGDEGVKVLSIRGRACSLSRFELSPELWRVLSENLGWRDVAPTALKQ